VAPPFKEIKFDIIYGEGISREGDLLDGGPLGMSPSTPSFAAKNLLFKTCPLDVPPLFFVKK
jgi:hypothetical protein